MKIKNKKKLATSLGAAAVAAIMIIGGGTFAYYQADTSATPLKNVIQNAKTTNLTLTETTGTDYKIIPGTSQAKDPVVKLDTTVDAYLFVEVTDTSKGLVTWEKADGWQVLKTEGDKTILWREVPQSDDGALAEYPVLDGNKISYDKTITNADTTDSNGMLNDPVELTFIARAIQKAPFNDESVAYAVLTGFEPGEEPAVVSTPAQLEEAIENGEPVVLTQDITASGVISAPAKVKINGNGHTINVAPGATRILNFDGNTEELDIDLADLTLDASGAQRGISFYGNTEGGEVDLSNVTVIADMYAINVASNNGPMDINVDKMTAVTGWCAYQSWSPDVHVTFTNCELIGINDKTYNAEGWNDFSTLVLYESAENNTVTVIDSTIEANATTGNKQTLFSNRSNDQEFILENNTYKKDGVELTALEDLRHENSISYNAKAIGLTLTDEEIEQKVAEIKSTGKITIDGTQYSLGDFFL